jgi:ubiquinone/menaquinone biosynthesis C-methylase UbiE
MTPRAAVTYEENNQEIVFVGVLRPRTAADLEPMRAAFARGSRLAAGTLFLNTKRLRQMNDVAFRELTQLVRAAAADKPDRAIRIVTTSVVGWATRRFRRLAADIPNVTVEQYDDAFYPGQQVLENGGFVPILRTQTKMTWRHEQYALRRHGLTEGMRVADVCCGIGDFAVLMHRTFSPARLVALDHAKTSLDYARQVAREFGVTGIEYVYGDAAALLLDGDQFDFVTCRHALQVFDKPELILKELYRICKPGGRVYITNEKNSHCLAEPRGETVQWTYNEVARLWADFKMDIELGPKSRAYLDRAGFEDIRVESIMVTNLDGDPQDFADIIQAWEDVYAGDMAVRRGDSPEFIARFRRGFQDHIHAALHPQGYAGWPIWIASGRKPA